MDFTQQLPSDVLSTIFVRIRDDVLEDYRRSPVASNSAEYTGRILPARTWDAFSRVSTHWRKCALSTPILWSAIVLEIARIEHAETMLRRSSHALIDVEVNTGDRAPPGLTAAISEAYQLLREICTLHAYRLRSLRIYGANPDDAAKIIFAPAHSFLKLQTFAISPGQPASLATVSLPFLASNALELRTLSIKESHLDLAPCVFNSLASFELAANKDSEMRPPSCSVLASIIDCMPRIETLRISNCFPEDAKDNSLPIQLPPSVQSIVFVSSRDHAHMIATSLALKHDTATRSFIVSEIHFDAFRLLSLYFGPTTPLTHAYIKEEDVDGHLRLIIVGERLRHSSSPLSEPPPAPLTTVRTVLSLDGQIIVHLLREKLYVGALKSATLNAPYPMCVGWASQLVHAPVLEEVWAIGNSYYMFFEYFALTNHPIMGRVYPALVSISVDADLKAQVPKMFCESVDVITSSIRAYEREGLRFPTIYISGRFPVSDWGEQLSHRVVVDAARFDRMWDVVRRSVPEERAAGISDFARWPL